MEVKLTKITIDNVDVFLDEIGPNAGKITISDSYNHNYSYYWGAMGGTLANFITLMDPNYFANNLINYNNRNVFDAKKTFAVLRKFIKEELDLPWYKHQEFQKNLREVLNEFENEFLDGPSINYFVDNFYSMFINRLSYDLIGQGFEREFLEKEFRTISEPWEFSATKESDDYIWLKKFHTKLKKSIKKLK